MRIVSTLNRSGLVTGLANDQLTDHVILNRIDRGSRWQPCQADQLQPPPVESRRTMIIATVGISE